MKNIENRAPNAFHPLYQGGDIGTQFLTSQFGIANQSDTHSSKPRKDEIDDIYQNIDDFEYKLKI